MNMTQMMTGQGGARPQVLTKRGSRGGSGEGRARWIAQGKPGRIKTQRQPRGQANDANIAKAQDLPDVLDESLWEEGRQWWEQLQAFHASIDADATQDPSADAEDPPPDVSVVTTELLWYHISNDIPELNVEIAPLPPWRR